MKKLLFILLFFVLIGQDDYKIFKGYYDFVEKLENLISFDYDNIIEYSRLSMNTSMLRCIVIVDDTVHLFTEGTTGGRTWNIYKRTSLDGLHFSEKSDTLIADDPTSTFDNTGVADPTVIYDGAGDWKMWFDASSAVYWDSIGYATSVNGIDWTNQGAVIGHGTSAWDDKGIHHPACIKYNGTYYLYYSGSHTSLVDDIGLATSTNGISWTKYVGNPVLERGANGTWDDDYLRPSNPVKIGNYWYMYYWGYDGSLHHKGLAKSSDLYSWTKLGQITDRSGGDYTGTWSILTQGSNDQDKIITMWYEVYPNDTAFVATISNILPENVTRVSGFTTSADLKYGDYVHGTIFSARAANYIYLYRITVGATMEADAIKTYISWTNKTFSDGKYVKCALYTNNVATPANLIDSTEVKNWSSIIGNEWTIFRFYSGSIELSAADYWIAIWSNNGFKTELVAGGSNNFGVLSLAYGTFPNPITATTNQAYSNCDFYLIETKSNVWEVPLTTSPTSVFFNSIEGHRQTAISAVDSEFDWMWASNVLYIYAESNPDLRYQISYR